MAHGRDLYSAGRSRTRHTSVATKRWRSAPCPTTPQWRKRCAATGKSRPVGSMPALRISVRPSPGSRSLACAIRVRATPYGSPRAIFAAATAPPRDRLIEDVLETSRALGYLHFEGAGVLVDGRMPRARRPRRRRAPRRGRDGDPGTHRRAQRPRARDGDARGIAPSRRRPRDGTCSCSTRPSAIFQALGTLDEPARVEAARAALDRGQPIDFCMLRNGLSHGG